MEDNYLREWDHSLIMQCPLRTNIANAKAYLMPPDESLFFDWLIIKQSFVFKDEWFYYSRDRINDEIHIKKDRLNVIVKRFEAMDILSVKTEQKPNEVGRTRYFKVNYGEISKRLNEFIDESNPVYRIFELYFQALTRRADNRERGTFEESQYKKNLASYTQEIYDILCNAYKDRVEMYNGGELNFQRSQRPKRKINAANLARTAKVNRLLRDLSKIYDATSIEYSFIAYSDALIRAKHTESGERYLKKVEKPLAYFLTTDADGYFPVVNEYLDYFLNHYSHQ